MKKIDPYIVENNYSNMSDQINLKITKNFTDVGTVSYPKKFGDTKFPITYCEFKVQNVAIGKTSDFSRLCVCLPENIVGSKQDYKNWCLYNGITKSVLPNF